MTPLEFATPSRVLIIDRKPRPSGLVRRVCPVAVRELAAVIDRQWERALKSTAPTCGAEKVRRA